MSVIYKYTNKIFNFIISVGRILKYNTFIGGLPYSKKYLEGDLHILGTGPSLKDDLVENIHTFVKSNVFVVNDFAFGDCYDTIRPRYYVFADPGYWLSENLTTENNVSLRKRLFNEIKHRTSWNLTIYVPKVAIGFFKDNFYGNNNISFKSYNSIDINDFETKWGQYCLKRNFAAPCVNVLGMAIYLAINMGYKTIKIYGADHSWTEDLRVDHDNRVCTISKHFYDNDGENKLTPWFKANNQMYKMHEILSDLSKTFHYYLIINNYAKNKGSIIYNRSSHSFIDAFIRENI